MSDFEFRMRIQGAVQEFVENFMKQNNLSAAVMEDAMNKSMVWLKDQVLKETVLSMTQAKPQEPESEKEEDNGGE
nr:MAG TPA: hypothetical protein [Caudoviricetes sp.]